MAYLDYCLRSPGDCGVDDKVARSAPAQAHNGAPDKSAKAEVSRRFWASLLDSLPGRSARKPVRFDPLVVETRVRWDATTQSLANGVNRSINQRMLPQSDAATYGEAEYWRAPTLVGNDRYGDCEDYALKKRQALIAAGVPATALSLAMARVGPNENHAVLMLTTDHGDMVLDNLSGWIVPWNKTGYRWEIRQSTADPFRWIRLSVGPRTGAQDAG